MGDDKTMRSLGAAWVALLFALAGLGLLTGCGGGHARGTVVHISERDFRITAPRTLPRGRVRLVVANKGPVAHELLLVRSAATALPLRPDGFTIDEDALHGRLIASIEPQEPGAHGELDLDLARGTYILLCNMSGHAAGGMQTTFTVR